jgi:hypothetical protein
MTDFVSFILQTVVALVVILFLWFITIWIMESDKIFVNSKYNQDKKLKVHVLNGYVSASTFDTKSYNTMYQEHPRFLPIKRSVNRRGGAQFTYYFWMYVDNPVYLLPRTREDPEYTLFIKGDHKSYPYSKVDEVDSTTTNFTDKYVMCPQVSYGRETNDLEITFNSTRQLKHKIKLESKEDADSAMRHNLTSLQPKKWMLYTIIFNDNMPLNEFENGLLVRIFVNDILYQTEKLSGVSIIQNNGDFTLFPDYNKQPSIEKAGLKLSDLTYCNYAMGENEVVSLFRSGPTLSEHMDSTSFVEEVLDLSSYNKLDIYNS